MAMDATIDLAAHEPLAHQPADYRIIPLEAVVDYAADGTPLVSKRNGDAGKQVEWIWGNVVDPATVQELVAARGGALTHSIAFNDKGGTAHNYNVLWLADPTYEAGPGSAYRPLTVRFIVLSEVGAS